MTNSATCNHQGCTLPPDEGCLGSCILHYDSPSKDVALFNRRLEEKIQHDKDDYIERIIDLSGVVFPAEANFRGMVFKNGVVFSRAKFTKRAYFLKAQFIGGAFFGRSQFGDESDFTDAQFGGEAYFSDTVFHGKAYFAGARFDGGTYFFDAQFHSAAYFFNAQFHDEAHFSNANFRGEANFDTTHFSERADFGSVKFGGNVAFKDAEFGGRADFGSVKFHGFANFMVSKFLGVGGFYDATFPEGADFTNATVGGTLDFRRTSFPDEKSDVAVHFHGLRLHSPGNMRFESVNLSGVSFLWTDLSGVPFVGNITWPQKEERRLGLPFWIRKRLAVYDELVLERDGTSDGQRDELVPLVAQEYRQLRINYEANRQEVEAGDFYVGQMEMRRQDSKTHPWLYRSLLAVYRWIAMYGESYVRPLLLYFVWAFVFAFFYLLGGFEVNGRVVDYTWPPDLSNTGSFVRDYARGLYYALTAGALLRGEITTISWWVPLVQYANMLADILLLGLTVVALRRKFHR